LNPWRESAKSDRHKNEVAYIVDFVIEHRKDGSSIEEISALLGMSLSTVFGAISTRSIEKYCPHLLEDFKDSKIEREKFNLEDAKRLAQLLNEGKFLDEVFETAKTLTKTTQRAVEITKKAMRLSYQSCDGEYYDFVSDIYAGEEGNPTPPHPKLDILKVHDTATRKRPKKCTRCNADSVIGNRLMKFRNGPEAPIEYLCRACLCADDPEVDNLAGIFERHQLNSYERQWTI
jgi:hypothetical protein